MGHPPSQACFIRLMAALVRGQASVTVDLWLCGTTDLILLAILLENKPYLKTLPPVGWRGCLIDNRIKFVYY